MFFDIWVLVIVILGILCVDKFFYCDVYDDVMCIIYCFWVEENCCVYCLICILFGELVVEF